nr:ABC transporter ATP-binding protein [Fererhizobium litorale]
MQDELKAIQKRVGTTFVHVTHDQEEAMAIADRIVVMNQGRVEDYGPPSDIYMRPKSLFSAGFMGEVNFLQGQVTEAAKDHAHVATPIGPIMLSSANFTGTRPASGDRVTLCIRPEHFCASDNQSAIRLGEAEVTGSAFFGTHFRCHLLPVAARDVSLVAHMPQSARVAAGDRIPLAVDPTAVTVLPVA